MNNSEKTIKKLSLPLFLISLPLTVMNVLLPIYTSSLGLTPIQITGLFSVFSLGLVIIRLFIGYITDKSGRKPIFVLGILFYLLSYYIFSIASSILLVYIGRSLQSIADVFISISTYSIIADQNMKNNARSLGLLDSYSEKGGLLGVILCFWVLNTQELVDGWSRLFILCTIASIIAFIYSIINLKETKPEKSNNLPNVSMPRNKDKMIFFNLIVRIFTSLTFSIFVLYLQHKFGSDLMEIGIAFLLPTVIIAFASPELGKISDNIGSKKSFSISLGVLAITSLILPYMNSIYLYGVIWTFYGIAFTLFSLTLDSIYVIGISEEVRGFAVGKLTMGANIGTIIGPLIAGFTFQKISINAPFYISFFGITMLLIFKSKFISVDSKIIENK